MALKFGDGELWAHSGKDSWEHGFHLRFWGFLSRLLWNPGLQYPYPLLAHVLSRGGAQWISHVSSSSPKRKLFSSSLSSRQFKGSAQVSMMLYLIDAKSQACFPPYTYPLPLFLQIKKRPWEGESPGRAESHPDSSKRGREHQDLLPRVGGMKGMKANA